MNKKKYIIFFILSLILLFVVFTFFISGRQKGLLPSAGKAHQALGDVSGNDAIISIQDVLAVVRHITGSLRLDNSSVLRADVDCNKNINILDLILMIRKIINPQIIFADCPVIPVLSLDLGPAPSGCTTITSMEVRNDRPVERREVAFSGVPLAQELDLKTTNQLIIVGPNNLRYPAQFNVLSRWNSGPDDPAAAIKWLETSILVNIPANTSWEYSLRYCPITLPSVTDSLAVIIASVGNIHTVTTGAATFVLDHNNPRTFQEIRLGSMQIYQDSTNGGPKVVDAQGNVLVPYIGPYDVFAIEQNGPVKAVIKVMGHFAKVVTEPTCDLDLAYVERFTFTRGSADVGIEFQIINECGDGFTYGNELAPFTNYNNWWNKRYPVQEVSFDLPLNFQATKKSFVGGGSQVFTSGEGFTGVTQIAQEIGEERNGLWRKAAITQGGTVLQTAEKYEQPFVAVGDSSYMAMIQMPWMRYREPQALMVNNNLLSFKFFSQPTVIGEAQGIWNFAKLKLLAGNISTIELNYVPQQGIAELERGLLLHVPSTYLDSVNVMPPITYNSTTEAGSYYTQFLENIHSQIEAQQVKTKSYGYAWPDYTIFSDFSGINTRPTQHTPYSNYWDGTDSEIKQWYLTGDPQWVYDFSLPQVYTQLVTNYYNPGVRNNLGGGGIRGGFVATSTGNNAPGEVFRTGGGSDDYTYAQGFGYVYTVRPGGMIRDRFADAGDTFIRRYNVPSPVPLGQRRDFWVNTLDLRRGVTQHMMLLMEAAEFSTTNNAAHRAKIQEVMDEYVADNFKARVFCSADTGNEQECFTDGGGFFHLSQGELYPFLMYLYWAGDQDARGMVIKETMGTMAVQVHRAIMRGLPNGTIPTNPNWFTNEVQQQDVRWFDQMHCTFTNNGSTINLCEGIDRTENGRLQEPFFPHAAPGALGMVMIGHNFVPNDAICRGVAQLLPTAMNPQTLWMEDSRKIGWNKGAAQGSHNVIHALAISERCGAVLATLPSPLLPPNTTNTTLPTLGTVYNTINLNSPIGTNLRDLRDFQPEWVFVDAFANSRDRWLPGGCTSGAWDTGQTLTLDNLGWVQNAPADVCPHAIMFWGDGASGYPIGTYVVLWEGSGALYVGGVASNYQATGTNRATFDVQTATPGLDLQIRNFDRTNYVRNIRVLIPGGVCQQTNGQLDYFRGCATGRGGTGTCNTGEQCRDFEEVYWNRFSDPVSQMNNPHVVFHPTTLSLLRHYKSIRYMNWMDTNDFGQGSALITSWNDRTTVRHRTQSRERYGVAYEYITALSNVLNADTWINIPHLADDNYNLELANFMLANLNPNLKLYVEYTNEAWNTAPGYPQTYWMRQQEGCIFDSSTFQWSNCPDFGRRFYAQRTAQIMDLWTQVYGTAATRLVRVLGGFASVPWWNEQLLTLIGGNQRIDALAIAPYFGDYINLNSADAIFTEINANALSTAEQNMINNAALATQYNVDLIAYEGGQHIIGGATVGANSDSRMSDVYLRYFQSWRNAGGKMFMHFDHLSAWSAQFGSWGALRRQTDSRANSPKYDALLTFMEQNPCWWRGCNGSVITPLPVNNQPPAANSFSDEFNDPGTLLQWTVPYNLYSTLDISIANPGRLTIIPTQSAWYADGVGPFVYKNINGNFVVETSVNAHLVNDPTRPATGGYASGGLVIRDPRSVPGVQNWIMYNTGNQGAPFNVVGTERKDTINSNSALNVRAGVHFGRLRVCRLGNTFHLFRWLDNENGWTEELTTQSPAAPFVRNDFPPELQVGLVANAYTPPVDVVAEFDYVRLAVPNTLADCTAVIS